MDLKKLLEQQSALAKQIKEALAAERPVKIAEVKEIVKMFGLTAEDIFGPSARGASKVSKPTLTKDRPMYRNPENASQTYGGRGPRPEWLKKAMEDGKRLEDFRVSE